MEKQIQSFREYYEQYFLKLPNKLQARQEFSSMYAEYKTHLDKNGEELLGITNQETMHLLRKGRQLMEKYLGKDSAKIFDKEIKFEKRKEPVFTENFLLNVFIAFGEGFSQVSKKYERAFRYKMDMLKYTYLCLHNYGLHPSIASRPNSQKRYNLCIDYHLASKDRTVCKVLLPFESLRSNFLCKYNSDSKIIINGKFISPSQIIQVKITSTKLTDQELPLYAEKNGFEWNNVHQDSIAFLHSCQDETDSIIIDEETHTTVNATFILKNGKAEYIDSKRINELEAIKSKFDLSRLIQLCKELNSNCAIGNWISVSANLRAIIDHIPPIFGFGTFSQAVDNHKWEKSVKKSLKYLSLSRDISDQSLHTQAKKTESLPTLRQIDFSNNLDVLLAEIIKQLK